MSNRSCSGGAAKGVKTLDGRMTQNFYSLNNVSE